AAQIGAGFDALPTGLQKLLSAPFWQNLPTGTRQRSFVRRFKRLSEALAKTPAARQLQWMAVFGEALRVDLYTDEFVARLPNRDPVEFLAKAMARCKGRDAATVASLADLTTYLPGDILVKVDRASMAHGLECRSPFLDHRVVELAASLPIDYKLRFGRGKRILRDTFGAMLPPAILKRPKKGFGVPLEPWFRGELRDFLREILFDPRTESRGLFRSEVVARLVGEHLDRRFDHSARLWALLMLELWQREWLDPVSSPGDSVSASPERPEPGPPGRG
ncbi:MAG TPA: asparagine synthase C-terminal domain-containing protein, partial [Pirellulales bacterium]